MCSARRWVDLIGESVRMVMKELIEAEATEQVGTGRYERSESRVNERNGSRARVLAAQAGDGEPASRSRVTGRSSRLPSSRAVGSTRRRMRW
jgi:hypothetical protein